MAEIIALLKDGQIVEIDGNMFMAQTLDDGDSDSPCWLCNVDCLCRGDVARVCEELDLYSKSEWYLELVS